MTKRQKELMTRQLKREKAMLKALEEAYSQASEDIKKRIERLMAEYEATGLKSKIYQLKWQRALQKEVDGTLDRIRQGVYQTIENYRTNCYEEGYIGAVYDLQGQGVPLIFPIDPEQMVKAISIDSKLSKSLYDSLGISLDKLKSAVRQEISRGIASGRMYAQIASRIDVRMGTGRYNAYRIARTEGQRVTNEATFQAALEARKRGADVFKEWNGILDGRIRPDHATLHGQVKEMDEPFEVNGYSAMYPSGFGVAHEDINCRCRLLQRARWMVEDDGDGIIEADSFDDFKKKYEERTR